MTGEEINLRHSLAIHLMEGRTDIAIKELLGHNKPENHITL